MKCPVNTDNLSPFSSTSTRCRHHEMGDDNSLVAMNGSTRVRQPYSIKSPSTEYLRYSVPNATKALDLSFEMPENVSVFPRNIYKKEPFASKSPSLDGPRDSQSIYIHIPGVTVHSPYSSRFGYNRFPQTYEYGIGTQSRGYVEASGCHSCANDTPKNMAPDRFYTEYHLKNTPTEYRKMTSKSPNPKSYETLIH